MSLAETATLADAAGSMGGFLANPLGSLRSAGPLFPSEQDNSGADLTQLRQTSMDARRLDQSDEVRPSVHPD